MMYSSKGILHNTWLTLDNTLCLWYHNTWLTLDNTPCLWYLSLVSSTVQSLCPVAQFFPAGIVTTQSWPEREKFGILTQICFAGLSVSLLIFQHWAQHLSNIRLAILYNYLADGRHTQSPANSREPVILSSRTFLSNSWGKGKARSLPYLRLG